MLISCLRFYKYKISRKASEGMYKSFILPHFDNADIIWVNCTGAQSSVLEKLHLDAIRIIVVGFRGTSHQKLYDESRFSTLSLKERRRRQTFDIKTMQLGLCSKYLTELLSSVDSSTNPYHRRRPLCKTER